MLVLVEVKSVAVLPTIVNHLLPNSVRYNTIISFFGISFVPMRPFGLFRQWRCGGNRVCLQKYYLYPPPKIHRNCPKYQKYQKIHITSELTIRNQRNAATRNTVTRKKPQVSTYLAYLLRHHFVHSGGQAGVHTSVHVRSGGHTSVHTSAHFRHSGPVAQHRRYGVDSLVF